MKVKLGQTDVSRQS